jgi:hypothetical protein
MAAGAESISGIGLLRRGDMGRLFVQVRRPPTSGAFLRPFTVGHVRQLDAVAAQQLAEVLDAEMAAILGRDEVLASVG